MFISGAEVLSPLRHLVFIEKDFYQINKNPQEIFLYVARCYNKPPGNFNDL